MIATNNKKFICIYDTTRSYKILKQKKNSNLNLVIDKDTIFN